MNKNAESNSYADDPFQPTIVSLFSLVGMSICAAMGFIALYNHNFLLSSILLIASAIYLVGFYVCIKHNNIRVSSAIVLYSLYALMFYLVFTGGVEQTGPLWIFIVAPVSVFIHGLKRGLVDIAVFVLVISAVMFSPSHFFIAEHINYTNAFKLRLLYSFLTVTFLSALYEYSRERSLKQSIELSQKYQNLAHFDPLTGLANRRFAMDALTREQARVARNNDSLSILLCDIDNFKQINDSFGHNAGDEVLVNLSSLFTGTIRKQDVLSRWGGEEFLFILPQTDLTNAYVIAEKIRKTVEDNPSVFEHHNINATISIGIAQFDTDSSIDDIMKTADKYLYQAKSAGRNQTQPKQ